MELHSAEQNKEPPAAVKEQAIDVAFGNETENPTRVRRAKENKEPRVRQVIIN